jgi:hypothetical protein
VVLTRLPCESYWYVSEEELSDSDVIRPAESRWYWIVLAAFWPDAASWALVYQVSPVVL